MESKELKDLKEKVYLANRELVSQGLVIQTWGNASGIDRQQGLVVIKPSGLAYSRMRPRHMVAISLKTGQAIGGGLRPSSDTPTHLELYHAFKNIAGVVHTHSLNATVWAQAGLEIPPLGTTHADYFRGAVPCTRKLRPAEIRNGYERNTGKVIVQRFRTLDPLDIPAVLVLEHGPFVWGRTIEDAVDNAIVLEHVAKMATESLLMKPAIKGISRVLLDKHFFRKHGPGAYYGQK